MNRYRRQPPGGTARWPMCPSPYGSTGALLDAWAEARARADAVTRAEEAAASRAAS